MQKKRHKWNSRVVRQHASSLDRGAQVWFHADPFLVWEGGYWYLVTKEDVPDSVLEGLKLDAVI